MANQVYIPLQSLRIERVTINEEEKLYLVSYMQCWVYNFQSLRVKSAVSLGHGLFEITLANANTASSLTTCLWSGEQRFEISYMKDAQFQVKTTVIINSEPTGVVTNTISGSGDIAL